MKNNLYKYNDFITNEGLVKDIFGGLKNAVTGAKQKILNYISDIVTIEKDYIDKTDELTFNIYKASTTKGRGQINNPLFKQQELLNRRALEIARRAKESEVNYIQTKVSLLVKKDKELLNFYNKRATLADREISDYANQKAIDHRTIGYNSTYSNFLGLEDLRKKYDFGTSGHEGEVESLTGMEIPHPYNIEWLQFVKYVATMELPDVVRAEGEGRAFRIKVESAFKKFMSECRAKKAALKKSNDLTEITPIEADEKIKRDAYEIFMGDFDSKLELIKRTKLKK